MPVIAGHDVSRETFEKLHRFVDLTQKWTKKINLIAPSTIDQIWDRHIVDSAQLFSLVQENPTKWADLGSGGGLPAIVLAVLFADRGDNVALTCIESDQRKATFLRTCIRELELNGSVLANRSEQAPPQSANLVTARALAPLPKLLGYVERHLADDGVAILPKGENADQEIAEARKTWNFDLSQVESITHKDASILKLRNIARG